MIKSYRDLKAYTLAYETAMEVYWMTRKFPKEEMYSLTGQICRSSRSIGANIVEGWAKRAYPNIFKRHLLDAIGSCDETRYWLNIALDCKYISEPQWKTLDTKFEEIGRMLGSLFKRWHKIDDPMPSE